MSIFPHPSLMDVGFALVAALILVRCGRLGVFAAFVASATFQGHRVDFVVPATNLAPNMPLYPVLFLPGYRLHSSFYEQYFEALADEGNFIVISYRLALPLHDLKELGFCADLMRHIADIVPKSLQDRAEFVARWREFAVVGHSRGGKLATLLALADPATRPKAIFLIDPVDSGRGDPPSSQFYPSALERLFETQELGRDVIPFAIAQGDHIGLCNPPGRNADNFWDAAGLGSWRVILTGAGHAHFVDLPWWIRNLLR